MTDARHLALVGAMGAGKTTIGTRVAAALGRPFVDNDDALERATGSTAADLAVRLGIDALHEAEAAIVLDALRSPEMSVIACAASTITNVSVRDLLRERAWVVWLRAGHETLVARMPASAARPFGREDPGRLVRDQSRARDALFAAVADATFATDTTTVDHVVPRVVSSAREGGLGTQRQQHGWPGRL